MTNITDKSGLDREALVEQTAHKYCKYNLHTHGGDYISLSDLPEIIDLILDEYEKQVVEAVEDLKIMGDHVIIKAIQQVRK
jgi:hypothetical protein